MVFNYKCAIGKEEKKEHPKHFNLQIARGIKNENSHLAIEIMFSSNFCKIIILGCRLTLTLYKPLKFSMRTSNFDVMFVFIGKFYLEYEIRTHSI